MVNKGVIVLGSLAVGGVLVFALTRKAQAAPPPGGWCCPYNSAHGCFADIRRACAAHSISTPWGAYSSPHRVGLKEANMERQLLQMDDPVFAPSVSKTG